MPNTHLIAQLLKTETLFACLCCHLQKSRHILSNNKHELEHNSEETTALNKQKIKLQYFRTQAEIFVNRKINFE